MDAQRAHTYSYEPLPENAIRVLSIEPKVDGEIRCTMKAVDLHSRPLYTALSYTWGNPQLACFQQLNRKASVHTIYIDGCTKAVTQNLYRALLRLSSGCPATSIPIWIDALCINQSDEREKSSQVSRMDEVYEGATTVIAWLGEEDKYTQPGLQGLRRLADINKTLKDSDYAAERQRSLNDEYFSLNEEQWESLVAILSRAWFRRVWVIQEVVLAKRMVVVLGRELISFDVLSGATSYLAKTRFWSKLTRFAVKFTSSQNETGNKKVPGLGAVAGTMAGLGPAILSGALHPKMVTMHARGSEASDPRDYVYAMSGLTKMAIARKVASAIGKGEDPKKWENLQVPEVSYDEMVQTAHVFSKWAKFMIEEEENYILFSMVEDKWHRRTSDLPSWVPDLSTSMMPPTLRSLPDHRKWSPFGERRDGQILFKDDSTMIRTRAARFDMVASVAVPFNRLEETRDWATLLAFIRPLVDAGINRPLEALTRTITASVDEQPSGDPPLGLKLVRWLLARISAGLPDNSKKESPAVASFFAFLLGPSATRPASNDSVNKLLQDMSKNSEVASVWRNLYFPVDISDSKPVSVIDLETRGQVVRNTRRVFRTQRNYLGVAAESMARGDEVWIMPGSVTPFVLRKIDGGSYALIGEAFVHGIMQGEVADVLEWEEIEIS